MGAHSFVFMSHKKIRRLIGDAMLAKSVFKCVSQRVDSVFVGLE